MDETHKHIREVLEVVGGAPSLRDSAVRASWQRCVGQYGLDPSRMRDAYVVPDNRLREHRERLDALIRTARFGLEGLYSQVSGQGYVVLLSDDRGVTVDHIGDRSQAQALHDAGLTLGSDWSESQAGTNAVGACLASGEPVIIHQGDHFDATHIPLTCTAAPIYDARGALAAVLDVSALRSPESKHSQALAMQLVRASTLRIEMAHLMAGFRSNWIMRFSRSQAFVDVDPEAAIAIDDSGCVVGMTHAGRKLMAHALGLDWRQAPSLLGRRFSEAFDVELDELPSLTRALPTQERRIQLRNGGFIYANAAAPQPVPMRSRRNGGEPAESPARVSAPLQQLTGGDAAMQRLLTMATKLADKPISLLLHGETGSGKEVLARAIHNSAQDSSGRERPFVAVNCAALPESLIESELFGYAPGAFTGARAKGRRGLIVEADGGTLFLDEIGDMPLALQARLLRVLAEREVQPLGGSRPIAVNLRVISASHRDLSALVRDGQFREDLFFRLSAARLAIPPLRERSDLSWLVDELLRRGTSDGHVASVRLSAAARALIEAHDWPGNIRELINVLELARVLCSDGVIEIDDLPAFSSASIDVVPTVKTESSVAQLLTALRDHGWNVSAVARSLGVDRTTVHRRMRKHGLVPPNRRHH